MKKPYSPLFRLLAASALLGCGGSAFAAVQTFSWSAPSSGTSAGTLTNTTGPGTTLAASLLSATAWSNTGTSANATAGIDGGVNSNFVKQSLANYGSNFGVTTNTNTNTVGGEITAFETGGSAPNHAMDNNGAQEFVLFEFSQAVTLNQLSISWPGTGTTNWGSGTTSSCTSNCVQDGVGGTAVGTELSVLAYVGADMTSAQFQTMLASTNSSGTGLGDTTKFKSASIVDPNPNNALTNITFDSNGQASGGTATTAPSSRFWLIGAYNQHLGGGGSAFNDAVKLATFKGTTCSAGTSGPGCTPPGGGGGGSVPEPSTLALTALGLIGGVRRWKLRKAA